ncbi:MAG TPA: hypothetical protein VGK88_11760 [bacterium]|jgi:hypothetical protein
MPAGRRGSSLLEVIVVFGILGAMVALMWTAGPYLRRLSLHAAAGTLVGDLRAVQAKAIAERVATRSYGIVFSVPSDRYTLVISNRSLRTPLRVVRLAPGVTITYARFGGGAPTAALFSSSSLFGAPSGAGTVTLRAGPSALCVRVLPATGRIRVADTNCP